jgi:hypothetical protein
MNPLFFFPIDRMEREKASHATVPACGILAYWTVAKDGVSAKY